MLKLITAVPGSGKTLYCVGLINGLVNSSEPRFIYHNINGLNIDSPFLLPAPDDWRTVPDGSVIFYDECQEMFPATGKAGRVNDEVLTDLETHRHRGIDIYFITQHPTFIHHHIRKLCGEHIHFYRAHGVRASVKYVWSHVCLEPNDRQEQQRANSSIFKFDRSLFKLYKSTVLDTHKFRMPKKGWWYLFLLVSIFSFVFYMLSSGFSSLRKGHDVDEAPAQQHGLADTNLTFNSPISSLNSVTSDSKSINPYDTTVWSAAPVKPPVAGCVHFPSKRRCSCYSQSGLELNLTYAACVSAMSSPLPRNINLVTSSH